MSQLKPEIINPVELVTVKREKLGIRRLVSIAEGAKDAFSIGEAVVDGVVFYHYATGARALVGMP